MSDRYIVCGPSNGVANGEQFSQGTENVDLSAASWAPTISSDTQTYRCPRAFIPNADGTLGYTALDSAAVTTVVKQGLVYPIAIKAITRGSCSASLQIANAVTLLY